LRRFGRYCCTRSISPAEVELATLHAFRDWLDHRTYEMNAGRVASVVRQAWNKQVAVIGIEGAKALPALGSPRRVSLPPEMLPSQLVGDIAAYGEVRRALDPFAGPAVRRSSEATIRDRMKRLTYAASLLIRAGVPTERVSCLRSLVTRDNLISVLRTMMTASSLSEPRMHHLHTALAFIDAATTYLQLADDELRQLHDVRARIKPPKPGLSQRAAQRLHPFDDQRVRAKLLALPDKLFAAAELQRKAGQSVRAAETHERGLALAILLVQPLRRRALAAIDADTHFTRGERGRIVRLVLPGSVIKNGVAVDAPIDAMLAKRIEQHLTQFRPAIRGADKCRFLFPAPDGRARTPDAVARGVTKVVKQELGVAFSIGLIRHIVATMLYESSPQAGPVAQRLLGHTSVKTTETLYGHLTTRSAHDTWARIVEKQRRRSGSGGGNR
jgi:integrase